MTFSTTAFSSARRWLAVAAVFALSLPTPAAASGFYAPSSTLRLPDAVLDAAHDVAYPSGTAPVRLSDYHHAKRDDAEKFVVVVATYFTGCTPGRADYPSFTKYVTALRTRVDAGDLPGNVKFVVSLKNGVNEGVAKAWAEIDGADDVSSSSFVHMISPTRFATKALPSTLSNANARPSSLHRVRASSDPTDVHRSPGVPPRASGLDARVQRHLSPRLPRPAAARGQRAVHRENRGAPRGTGLMATP